MVPNLCDSKSCAHSSTKYCLSGYMRKRKGCAASGASWGFRGPVPFPVPATHPSPAHSASHTSLSSGIPTVPGKVTLQKDAQNLIGISIGGGAQYCPCLYIVQVRGALEVAVRSWREQATSLLARDRGRFHRLLCRAGSFSRLRSDLSGAFLTTSSP